jgi:hypothetical protein
MKKTEGSLLQDDLHGDISWAQLVLRSSMTSGGRHLIDELCSGERSRGRRNGEERSRYGARR